MSNHAVYLHGRLIPSKKVLKNYLDEVYQTLSENEDPEELKNALSMVAFNDTSIFGGGFSGPLSDAPRRASGYTFVGPDPWNKRSFYGTVSWNVKKNRWEVK